MSRFLRTTGNISQSPMNRWILPLAAPVTLNEGGRLRTPGRLGRVSQWHNSSPLSSLVLPRGKCQSQLGDHNRRAWQHYFHASAAARSPKVRATTSGSRLSDEVPAPVRGVEKILKFNDAGNAKHGSVEVQTSVLDQFALHDRVAIVSGGNRGLGLEMALTLAELGSHVHVIDLPDRPSSEFKAVSAHVRALAQGQAGPSMSYISADVTKQKQLWDVVEQIATEQGRMDVCIAAAGILGGSDCLEYPAAEFEKIMSVNCNGVFYTAQAAGQQMLRHKNGGSIILIASMSGSITNRSHDWVAYNTSKSAVLQMARSMACELGQHKIRVNTLSPGHIYTRMTAALLDKEPALAEQWADANPLGRLGRPDELSGVIAWLASDASTFCTGSDIIVSGGHTAW